MKKFTKGLKKAFTITELVIVIAVIAILAAVLIPTFSSVISSAKESAAMQECHNAFTDLSAELEEQNKSSAGVVLMNDGYVFVSLNGKLNQIDGLDKLPHLTHNDVNALKVEGTAPSLGDDKPTVTGFEAYAAETYADARGLNVTVTAPKLKGAANAETSTTKIILATNQEIYLYTLTFNETKILGYFVMEKTNAKNTRNNGSVTVSTQYGYVVEEKTEGAEQGSIAFSAVEAE